MLFHHITTTTNNTSNSMAAHHPGTHRQEADAPPARVMVFARSQDEAQALAGPLRNVLWGEHRISVLLPEGEDPIRVRAH